LSMTVRGRIVAALISTLVIVVVVVGLLVVGGRAGLGPLATAPGAGDDVNGSYPRDRPPTHCPLSGIRPEGGVPSRPALAVKVENLPSSRPQTGISWADIVYEEPVEVGITRFIAVYQCQEASRIQPVRSARFTDPDILRQLGSPLLGYSGAVPQVVAAIREAGLVDLSEKVVPDAYHRDPEREPPHDLYTSTQELYAAAQSTEGAPLEIFEYSDEAPSGGKAIREIHLRFSVHSDISWRWDGSARAWIRYDTGEPHVLSDGTPIRATNVVVQVIETVLTNIRDVNGARSPRVVAAGTGRAIILRGGKMYSGTWERPSLDDVTKFFDAKGDEIPLAPGNTWVELFPKNLPITSS
jgi:hypothetical protein